MEDENCFFKNHVILENITTSGNIFQCHMKDKILLTIVVASLSLYECQYYMAGKKYWKISLVDMVITCENIGFITRGLWPLVINPIVSLVITITTRDIFQYFFPAIYYYLN